MCAFALRIDESVINIFFLFWVSIFLIWDSWHDLYPKLPPGLPLRSEVSIRTLKRRLGDLSRLRQASYSRVSLAASLVLMEQNALSIEQVLYGCCSLHIPMDLYDVCYYCSDDFVFTMLFWVLCLQGKE